VGTGGPLDRIAGGAFGRSLAEKIKDGYIFGFSRGAYTARSLAGFISYCGLMTKTQMDLLPGVWLAWQDRDDPTDEQRAVIAESRRTHRPGALKPGGPRWPRSSVAPPPRMSPCSFTVRKA
jgi:hypothetical protein